jgi:hypothetical protein
MRSANLLMHRNRRFMLLSQALRIFGHWLCCASPSPAVGAELGAFVGIARQAPQVTNPMNNSPTRRVAYLLPAVAFVFWLLPSLRLSAGDSGSPVVIYDTHGSADEARWTRVTGESRGIDPAHTVLQNGLIRICYPARKADPRSGFSPLSERGAHVLYLNGGGEYQLVQDADFGDWTYVGGALEEAPSGFQILKNTPEECTVSLEFRDHKMNAADSEEPGAAAPVTKFVTLRQGEFGYTARIRADSPYGGEREVGFGGTRTHLFNYTASAAQFWRLGLNEAEGCCNYKFPKKDGAVEGDSWAVGFEPAGKYYRLVAISPTGPSARAALRFAQFRTMNPSEPGLAGSIIHYTRQPLQEYEAYVAAVPYDAAGTRIVAATDESLTLRASADGVYSIFSRTPKSDPAGNATSPFNYSIAFREVHLVTGMNRLPKGTMKLIDPIVVPVSNGMNFPADIAARYNRHRE